MQSSPPQATGWSVTGSDTKIEARLTLKNFRRILGFVTAVGELAESEFHHPISINFGWGFRAIPADSAFEE